MLKKVPVFVFIVGLTLVLLLSGFANGDLPPRPTPMPTPVPTELPTAVSPITGGLIQLHFATTADKTGLWTAVQWQGANDAWHTVEGWQGSFNPDGMVTWWVAPADLGKEPFRWQLLDGEGGELLAVSEPFTLPTTDGQVVVVTVEE